MIQKLPIYYPCRGSSKIILQCLSKMSLNAIYGINGVPGSLMELLCKELQKPISYNSDQSYREHVQPYIDSSIIFNDEIADNITEDSPFINDDYYVIIKRTCDSHLTDSEFSVNYFTFSISDTTIDYAHHGYSLMTGVSSFLMQNDFTRRLTC